MRTNNLEELMEIRIKIEFVSEVLRLMAKEAQNERQVEHLGFMLLQLQSILDKATTKIWDIESDETEDDLAEVDNGSQTA